MIVVDASALIELLLNRERARRIAGRILTGEPIYAPQLMALEVQNVIRKCLVRNELTLTRANQALEDFTGLPVVYYPHQPFLPRIWAMRHNITTYDAAYITLAEAMPATLLTCDERLAAAKGHAAQIEII